MPKRILILARQTAEPSRVAANARGLGFDVHIVPAESPLNPVDIARLARQLDVDAIYPPVEPFVVPVALAALELGLFGLTPAAAPLTCNKAAMRRALDVHGIANPQWREVHTPEEAVRAAADLGMPLVVKPIDSSGAKGLHRVDYEADLSLAVRQAMKYSTHNTVLLEQWLEGPEWDIDLVAIDGIAAATGVTGKVLSPPPVCVTTAVFSPGLPQGPQRHSIIEFAQQTVRALGVHNGIVHVEVKETLDGLRVIDVAGYPSTSKLGVDLSIAIETNAVLAVAGEPLRLDENAPYAVVWIPTRSGVVRELAGNDVAKQMPGIIEVTFAASPGDIMGHVVDRETRDRVGYVAACGETAEEAFDRARRAAACCKVITKPTV